MNCLAGPGRSVNQDGGANSLVQERVVATKIMPTVVSRNSGIFPSKNTSEKGGPFSAVLHIKQYPTTHAVR